MHSMEVVPRASQVSGRFMPLHDNFRQCQLGPAPQRPRLAADAGSGRRVSQPMPEQRTRNIYTCAALPNESGSHPSTGSETTTSTSSSSASGAAAPPSGDMAAQYQALVSELAPLSVQQIREAAHMRAAQLLDSRFLFWLRDRERRPGMGASEREVLSRLGQELTMMREWTEEQSNRTLLPSLASSLAYSNLRRWREETGGEAPEVVAGVDLEQLYRLGEEEERKLRRSMERGGGGGGVGPRTQGATRSGIEEFTKHNKSYADLAAGAMARVRARLMGFDDDGPTAASAVLSALLQQMGGAEERATYLPDAFAPPGLQIMHDASSTPSSSSAPGSSSSGGKPSFVVTTPDALVAAARTRLASLTNGKGAAAPASVATAATAAPASVATAATAATAASDRGAGSGSQRMLLPSGEDEVAALEELLELIEEYDQQVFSRKTPLERMGHNPGPW